MSLSHVISFTSIILLYPQAAKKEEEMSVETVRVRLVYGKSCWEKIIGHLTS